jgi:hypothetical protein
MSAEASTAAAWDKVGAPAATTAALAARLDDFVRRHLEVFAERYAPNLALPRAFGGFPVRPDARADLAFTLGLLHADGVETIAGVGVEDALRATLFPIDGSQVHSFFSYRVAETLARFGPFAANRLLRPADAATRRQLELACDSTDWLERLDRGLLPNYAAVLARCELARRALGLTVDPSVTSGLLDRTRRLIGTNESGYVDDSTTRRGQYDVYTVDAYLLTECFAEQLEPAWSAGARNVGDLVARVCARNGAAVTWGRSLGVLAVCHTIELGALLLARDLTDDGPGWLARLAGACAQLDRWTDGAVATIHRGRAQDAYRGPDRLLQTTFDVLGKLVWSAQQLRRCRAAETCEPFPHRDELVRLETERHAAVWTYRSDETAFVLPFVGPAWADYLPGPRSPGLFEVPVDAPLPAFVPVVTVGGERYVPAGLPAMIEHRTGRIHVVWERLARLTPGESGETVPGRREMTVTVERHVLRIGERLHFPTPPDAVELLVTEARDRPLRVDVQSDVPHRIERVETKEAAYRSFWSELPVAHRLELEPRTSIELTWSVRPLVRVATNEIVHHYHRSLYDPLADDVAETYFPTRLLRRPDEAREVLERVDAFHLHWPEWLVESLDQADLFVRLLEETGTALIWTQHNLRPHAGVDGAHAIYQRFADAAALVLHHSDWGRGTVCDRYRFRADATHIVLRHGRFAVPADQVSRAEAVRELGLATGVTRIGIIGAPRAAKRVQDFMDAFAATTRPDLELIVFSLDGERVPDDPRIHTFRPAFVDREAYGHRLALLDAVALPFDPGGEMLTTGLVADVVGAGLPAIVSRWPYLRETLGDAGISYGDEAELIEVLEGLNVEQLARAAAASRALQAPLDWERLAPRLFDAIVSVGAIKC